MSIWQHGASVCQTATVRRPDALSVLKDISWFTNAFWNLGRWHDCDLIAASSVASLKIATRISTTFENFVFTATIFATSNSLPVAYNVTRNAVTNEMLATFGNVRFYNSTSGWLIFNKTIINWKRFSKKMISHVKYTILTELNDPDGNNTIFWL